jgi:hypothetical protein
MLLLGNAQTYWLNVTNIGLGAAAIVLVALLLRSLLQDMRSRKF